MAFRRVDYWKNGQPKCPHCGADFDVWGGDTPLNLSYEDGGQTALDCASCGKGFVCVTHVQYEFSTAINDEAADNEDWGPALTRTEQTERAIHSSSPPQIQEKP